MSPLEQHPRSYPPTVHLTLRGVHDKRTRTRVYGVIVKADKRTITLEVQFDNPFPRTGTYTRLIGIERCRIARSSNALPAVWPRVAAWPAPLASERCEVTS